MDKVFEVVLDRFELWPKVVLLFVKLSFEECKLSLELFLEDLLCVLLDFVEFG